jgi:transient receptor potential cation channel subfamily A protein 1
MVAHGRVELLAHPLSQKYLQMKWNSYGKYFHLANLLVYCIFLAFVTIFAAQLMEDKTVTISTTKYANSVSNVSQPVANQEVLV